MVAVKYAIPFRGLLVEGCTVIGNEVSRWVLSALFAGLGAWYLAAAGRELFPLGRRRRLVPAVGTGLQAVMCAVMIGMSWSWGAGIPAIAQVTVFTAGGGWFVGRALFGARTGAASVGEPAGKLPAGRPGDTVRAGTTGPMGAMPGMAAAAGRGPAAMAMGAPAWWVSAGCLLLCAAFFGAALYFATTLWLRQGRGAGTGALMAAGMAVTFLQMAGTGGADNSP
jgi:hypothetical protein